MDLTLQDKKIELIQWLSTLDNLSIIEKLLKVKESEKTDWWNDLSEAEKTSIEKGLQDAKEGKFTPHSEVRKIYEKWL